MTRAAGIVVSYLLFAACAAPPPADQKPAAQRQDVTDALKAQLELVLRRERDLREKTDEASMAERRELRRLAAGIAAHLIHIDPKAEVPDLRAGGES
jgi:hypothetical protein